MLELIVNYISYAMLLLGSFLSLTFGLGLLRFPDFYSRMHAAGVADTLCAGLIIFGLMLQAGLTLISVKLFLILLFIWFTSPTSSFTLASTAYRCGYGTNDKGEQA
ncbi:MAG: monovalent cation/H(+) antiporter subunit G [Gammaproteobacteria bacterium]|nr:monovalent cation/H(+) antiporter subunit G [Gammaproteobacteria bacterium]